MTNERNYTIQYLKPKLKWNKMCIQTVVHMLILDGCWNVFHLCYLHFSTITHHHHHLNWKWEEKFHYFPFPSPKKCLVIFHTNCIVVFFNTSTFIYTSVIWTLEWSRDLKMAKKECSFIFCFPFFYRDVMAYITTFIVFLYILFLPSYYHRHHT